MDTEEPGLTVREPTETEILQYWEKHRRDFLLDAGSFAQKNARSWRKFNVGNVVLAYKKGVSPDQRFQLFYGANVKIEENLRPVCAEMSSVLPALFAGFDWIVGIALWGEVLEDAEHGAILPFLHPCVNCRKTMAQLPIVTSTTRVMSVWLKPPSEKTLEEFRKSPDFTEFDLTSLRLVEPIEMDFGEMMRFHAEIASSKTAPGTKWVVPE